MTDDLSTFSSLYLFLINCPACNLILFFNHKITGGRTYWQGLLIRVITLLFSLWRLCLYCMGYYIVDTIPLLQKI
jgi:hypothetical protein